MNHTLTRYAIVGALGLLGFLTIAAPAQTRRAAPRADEKQPRPASSDAVAQAQTPLEVPAARPEQKLTEHDKANLFTFAEAEASSPDFKGQPNDGENKGIDYYRDAPGAPKPGVTFKEVMEKESAAKEGVMQRQRQLLEKRFNLAARTDPQAKMSRGKPLPVGPTARLANGTTFETLAAMSPSDIKKAGVFPYPSLPHPLQANGGQVFPKMQLDMFPRLQRFDVEFDLPDAFLPEFPPAIFLSNRPELGDVSRGQIVSINNY
jgi:hypothetical protein